MKRLFSGVLIGVVELDSEPERAVLLHRGTHEQSALKRWKPRSDNSRTIVPSQGSVLVFISSNEGQLTFYHINEDNI